MVIKSKIFIKCTPRNLTVEAFIRIESRILMSIAFFIIYIYHMKLSYMKSYWRWEKVCWPRASYQQLPVLYIIMSLSDAKTVVSSAKWTKHIWFEDLFMSLIYKRKSTLPNTEPCRIPYVMFDKEELQLLIETYCFMLLKWDSNQSCLAPVTPLCRSLLINMLWLTVWKAFEKSGYTALVLCFLSDDE